MLLLKIVLEGVRGTSIRGDIAIDDTNITTGACQGKNLFVILLLINYLFAVIGV